MCTVTWLHRPNRYELFFNRDELKTRKPEIPAELREQNGVRFIAPLDGNANGTWILTNEFGLTVCIINRYKNHSENPEKQTTSRGLLVLSFAECATVQAAQKYLKTLDLNKYRPFTLTFLQADQPAIISTWDGKNLKIDKQGESQIPLTTSSINTDEICAWRKNLYYLQIDEPNADALKKFHSTHDPKQGAWSVCMKRDDAMTVSFCHVAVNENKIQFRYKPAPPDEPVEEKTLTLNLKQN